jgi:predicted PurR-regulated permease PerM
MDYSKQIPANKIRQVLFLISSLGLGLLMYMERAFLVSSLLGSVALYTILRKPMYKLVYERKWKKWAAATLLMTTSFIIIVLPFAWMISVLVNKISPIIHQPQVITDTVNKIQQFLNHKFGADLLSKLNLDRLVSGISSIVPRILGSALNALTNMVVAYFLLWFLLTNANKVELWLQRNLPFRPENRQKVLLEVKESVVSNTIGLPIMGLLQGGLAALGYWIFGAQDPILWGIVTGICSFIPFVGTMAAWVPIAILTFANGDTANGIGQTAWGLIVIGMSDNVLRMILQRKLGDIHPIITVFGVIVGINLFGFLGLIFGPLLISLFLLLVKIYANEFIDRHIKVDNITGSPQEQKDKPDDEPVTEPTP